MGHQNYTDKEIEELIKIVENDTTNPINNNKETDVERFIQYKGIQAGDSFVSCSIIYADYCRWKRNPRMNMTRFFKRFKGYFERKTRKFEVGYMLDANPFDVTPEGYFKARAYLRNLKNVKKRQKI